MATKKTSSTTSVTDIGKLLARPDPLPMFKWRVKVLPKKQFGVDESYVESVDLSWNNIKAGGHFAGGGYTYFPEFHDISAFSINLYADAEGRSLKYINSWKSKVKNFDTGLYGLPKDYKDNLIVQLRDNKDVPIVEVTLQGVWPSDLGNVSLDYSDGSSRVVWNLTLSVDGQSITFLK